MKGYQDFATQVLESELYRFIKALLFASAEPLTVKDIQKVWMCWHQGNTEKTTTDSDGKSTGAAPFSIQESSIHNQIEDRLALLPTGRIREALEALAESYESKAEVYRLIKGPRGYQLTTAPDCAQWIRLLRKEPRPVRLSPAAMETLAVIAYRQPTTRSEIEFIRGVSVDNPLNKLLERELINVAGRADLPGRPLQYKTTEKFLEFVGISSLEELPASDILGNDQINTWIRDALASEKGPSSPLKAADIRTKTTGVAST